MYTYYIIKKIIFNIIYLNLKKVTNMNRIDRLKFQDIKKFGNGQNSFDFKLTNCDANCVNIIVAPNGTGKSSLATALKSVAHGKLKLDRIDQKKGGEHPSVTISLVGDNRGEYTSNLNDKAISEKMNIYVINSSLNAKSINNYINNRPISSAELTINDIVIYKQVPDKSELGYRYENIRIELGLKRCDCINLSNIFNDSKCLKLLLEEIDSIKACYNQTRLTASFNNFLNYYSGHNSDTTILISAKTYIMNNNHFLKVFDIINKIYCDCNYTEDIRILSTIQLCRFIGKCITADNKSIKKTYDYLDYKLNKQGLDKYLKLFNTTGRPIKSKVKNNSLIISFTNPKTISNGERDILSFIGQLIKFRVTFKKNIGILLIDEVFDYLDGSNLLGVQYFLSIFIDECRKSEKILFPIILTHLDPIIFNTYYLKNMKIHYYMPHPIPIDRCSPLIQLIKKRSSDISLKDDIEKYFLHYSPENKSFVDINLDITDIDNNQELYATLFKEVKDKYLTPNSTNYDSLMVILALRVKIEQTLYGLLPDDKKELFINTHTTIKKIIFAEKNIGEVPDSDKYHILRPLYNEALHINVNTSIENKLKSSYLKLHNKNIQRMIANIFGVRMD